jgi:hypothetical protein
MSWKKKITGLTPGRLYEVAMDLEFASSVAEGLMGIGGPPGEAVTVKLGATPREPTTAIDKQGWLRTTVRKGNQSAGGMDLAAVGNVAKPADGNEDYVILHRDNRSAKKTVRAAADGSAWLVFGADSGFEGTTALYFTKLSAIFVPVRTSQAIAFPVFPKKNFLSRPFAIPAKANSGKPLEFTSSNPEVATVEGGIITIREVGQTVITAHHAGDDKHRPARASRLLTVDKARQSIVFRNLPSVVSLDSVFNLSAVSTSGLANIVFKAESSGVLEIDGTVAKAVGKGKVFVTAEHSGNSRFASARVRRLVTVK